MGIRKIGPRPLGRAAFDFLAACFLLFGMEGVLAADPAFPPGKHKHPDPSSLSRKLAAFGSAPRLWAEGSPVRALGEKLIKEGTRSAAKPIVAGGPYAKPLRPGKESDATGGGAGIAGTPCESCPVSPVECGGTFPGQLVPGDCALGDGSSFDLWRLEVPGTRVVTIEYTSAAFDCYLFLVDENCDVLAQNDDCQPQTLSSCLLVSLTAGTYFILANSYEAGETGPYSLKVTCAEPTCGACTPAAPLACGDTRSGVLTREDCVRPDGRILDIHPFELTEPGRVSIEIRSGPIDPVLLLLDGNCGELAANDNCRPDDFDVSCLALNLDAGSYHVGVTSFVPGETGVYEILFACPDIGPCRDCEAGSVACGGEVKGEIKAGDCELEGGVLAEVWSLDLPEVSNLSISLTSGSNLALDLLDEACQVVATNDECATEGVESCLTLRGVLPGSYSVRVKGAQGAVTGTYQLQVTCSAFDPCQSCPAGTVACGGEVTGTLEAGDCALPSDGTYFDVWSFHLDEAFHVSIDLASPSFDTFLFLLDSSCQALAANENCTGTDSCLGVNLEPGDYFIVANSSVPGTGPYTLAVSCGPDPVCEEACRDGDLLCGGQVTGALAAEDCALDDGSFFDAYSLRLDEPRRLSISLASTAFDTYLLVLGEGCNGLAANDDCDGTNSCLTVDLPAGNYLVLANSFEGGSLGPYTLALQCGPNPLCSECRAGTIACNGSQTGTLPTSGCRHPDGSFIEVYDLNLTSASQVEIELRSAAFDTYLFLVDEDCNIIATNDDCTEGDTTRSCISLGLPAGGYAIWVNSYSAGETGDYTLQVSAEDCSPCANCRVGTIGCEETVQRTLSPSGCQLPGGLTLDIWELTLSEERELTISLDSDAFDPSLSVFDGSCVVASSNDDCDPNTLNACLTLSLGPGTHSLGVSNVLPGESGAYRLSVGCSGRVLPGDCTKDQILDLEDGVCVLGFLFRGSPMALPCGDGTMHHPANLALLDMDSTGSIDITDAVAIFLFLFSTGPPPPLGQECTSIPGCAGSCADGAP